MVAESDGSRPAIGVYVHIPFCARRCPYCDFAITVRSRPPIDAYHDALETELAARHDALHGRQLRSVYFGGGTPSLSGAGPLVRTLDSVRQVADFDPIEVTVEINPEDAPSLDFRTLADAGFNRVSIGAQSFDSPSLGFLGRQHSAAEITQAVDAARNAGIGSVSIDLIHGLPDDQPERLADDLGRLRELKPDHVSVYELTIEPKTRFARMQSLGRLRAADEDRLVDEIARIEAELASFGLRRYEVSNFARPGAEAVHNSGYWTGDEYLGLGVGAHSFRRIGGGALRRVNTASTRAYLEDPTGASAVTEEPSRGELLAELLLVGMRTFIGIDVPRLRSWFPEHVDALDELIHRWAADGLAVRSEHRARPTPSGMLVADRFGADAIERLCPL